MYNYKNSFKIKIIFILIFFPVIFLFSRNTEELVILHTNDTHGHPLKFDKYPATDIGGLPARATLVYEITSEYENILVLDAGDINTGRAESNMFNAEPDILGYNFIGYDAMVLGNHEFNHSYEILKGQMQLAKFPFISANVKTADGKYVCEPYIIKKFKNFKVAVFGLTLRETDVVGNPKYVKDYIFEDEVEVAKKLVPELRKKADIVIALVHMGIKDNPEEGSMRLAKYVEGIDLIIDGHSHTVLDKPIYINSVPIVQAGQWGMYIGKAVLTIERKKIVDFKWELIPINLKEEIKKSDGSSELKLVGNKKIEEYKDLLDFLQPYKEQSDQLLAAVIGEAEDNFLQDKVRIEETGIGDIIADAMKWSTGYLKVDFAILNGGNIRTEIPKGPISKKTIYEVLPFDNTMVVLTMKGSDIKALFDYIATIPQTKGGFPQVSAELQFTINYKSGKCEDILLNNNPISDDKFYKIVTNSYLAEGGDGYKIFGKAIDKYDTSIFTKDALIDYINYLGGKIKPEKNGRIKIIGKKTAYLNNLYLNKEKGFCFFNNNRLLKVN